MSQGFTRGVPIDIDPNLTANSNLLVASQAAVRAYINNYVIGSGPAGINLYNSDGYIFDPVRTVTLFNSELVFTDGSSNFFTIAPSAGSATGPKIQTNLVIQSTSGIEGLAFTSNSVLPASGGFLYADNTFIQLGELAAGEIPASSSNNGRLYVKSADKHLWFKDSSGTEYDLTLGGTVSLAALTMNSSGSGATSGTTYDGTTARTISYNTIGAQAASAILGSIAAVANSTGYLYNNGSGSFSYGTPTVPVGANPSATIGLTAVNGSAATFMTSDSAPALSQAIAPTWTGFHTFDRTVTATSSLLRGTYVKHTLTSNANGDTLIGLDIGPTFVNGGSPTPHTNISTYALRASGNVLVENGVSSFTAGTTTVSNPIHTLTQTWNASGTTFNGIIVNITDTASQTTSNFIKYQTGGTDRFVIRKNGNVTTGTWNGSTVTTDYGGTGLASYATGDIIYYSTGTTFSKLNKPTLTLSSVSITGTAGQFSCSASTFTLYVGLPIIISGTITGGTGSITGYTDPTTYYIIATNGSTTFTLSTTLGGTAVTTTAGTPTGLTYTINTPAVLQMTQAGVPSWIYTIPTSMGGTGISSTLNQFAPLYGNGTGAIQTVNYTSGSLFQPGFMLSTGNGSGRISTAPIYSRVNFTSTLSLSISAIDGGAGGTGYTNGTYTAVALILDTSVTYNPANPTPITFPKANITVTGGAVTSCLVSDPGEGIYVGTVFTCALIGPGSGFKAVATAATSKHVTGTLPVINGGTGTSTTFNNFGVVFGATGGSSLSSTAASGPGFVLAGGSGNLGLTNAPAFSRVNFQNSITLGTIVGGTGYTGTGTVYPNITLTVVSPGTAPLISPIADITVSGGSVSAVNIVDPGEGVYVGSSFSCNSTLIGGTGTGWSVPVTAATSKHVTGTLLIANGGTGLNSYTQGDLVYYNTGSTLSKIARPANVTLGSVAITGTAGQFSCTSTTLYANQTVTISGTNSGSGSITGYTAPGPQTYYIIGTPTSTTFTLSATQGGTAITTTVGTTTGLTFTLNAETSVLQMTTTGSPSWRPLSAISGTGGGGVTSITVSSSNGFTGSSSGGSTPALSIGTSVTGILYGDGTGVSALTVGTGLSLSGSTLTATGGGAPATIDSGREIAIYAATGNGASSPNGTITYSVAGPISFAVNDQISVDCPNDTSYNAISKTITSIVPPKPMLNGAYVLKSTLDSFDILAQIGTSSRITVTTGFSKLKKGQVIYGPNIAPGTIILDTCTTSNTGGGPATLNFIVVNPPPTTISTTPALVALAAGTYYFSPHWVTGQYAPTATTSVASFTSTTTNNVSFAAGVMTIPSGATAITYTGNLYPGLVLAATGLNANTIVTGFALSGTSTASSITGTTLTIGGTVGAFFAVGQEITGTGVAANTYITALGTGTGGAGTYTVNNSQTVASTAINSYSRGGPGKYTVSGTQTVSLGAVTLTGSIVTNLTLTSVSITGAGGQFSCTAATLALNQTVTISGVNSGTGSIVGYVNGATYYIIATNNSTTFTLSATLGGTAITTTAGTLAGLTFIVNLSNNNQINYTLTEPIPNDITLGSTVTINGLNPTCYNTTGVVQNLDTTNNIISIGSASALRSTISTAATAAYTITMTKGNTIGMYPGQRLIKWAGAGAFVANTNSVGYTVQLLRTATTFDVAITNSYIASTASIVGEVEFMPADANLNSVTDNYISNSGVTNSATVGLDNGAATVYSISQGAISSALSITGNLTFAGAAGSVGTATSSASGTSLSGSGYPYTVTFGKANWTFGAGVAGAGVSLLQRAFSIGTRVTNNSIASTSTAATVPGTIATAGTTLGANTSATISAVSTTALTSNITLIQATSATNITITGTFSPVLTAGQYVELSGFTANPTLNGSFVVASSPSASSFNLTGSGFTVGIIEPVNYGTVTAIGDVTVLVDQIPGATGVVPPASTTTTVSGIYFYPTATVVPIQVGAAGGSSAAPFVSRQIVLSTARTYPAYVKITSNPAFKIGKGFVTYAQESLYKVTLALGSGSTAPSGSATNLTSAIMYKGTKFSIAGAYAGHDYTTYATTTAHTYIVGDLISITGITPVSFNGIDPIVNVPSLVSTTGTLALVSGTTYDISNMTTVVGLCPGAIITSTAGVGNFGTGNTVTVQSIRNNTTVRVTISGSGTITAGSVTNITTNNTFIINSFADYVTAATSVTNAYCIKNSYSTGAVGGSTLYKLLANKDVTGFRPASGSWITNSRYYIPVGLLSAPVTFNGTYPTKYLTLFTFPQDTMISAIMLNCRTVVAASRVLVGLYKITEPLYNNGYLLTSRTASIDTTVAGYKVINLSTPVKVYGGELYGIYLVANIAGAIAFQGTGVNQAFSGFNPTNNKIQNDFYLVDEFVGTSFFEYENPIISQTFTLPVDITLEKWGTSASNNVTPSQIFQNPPIAAGTVATNRQLLVYFKTL